VKSKPDGYTLLFAQLANATSRSLYKLPYDLLKDLVPVAKIGNGPVVLTVHPSVPANSMKELLALAKKEPANSLVRQAVPRSRASRERTLQDDGRYRLQDRTVQRRRPSLTDTMGGHSQIFIGTLAICLPAIQAGRLRALGYGGPARSRLLPNVPTISEAAYRLPGR